MKSRPAEPPHTENLARLKKAALGCHACPLYKCGTQTVFGEGPKQAALMFVGEQPGDKEDLAGHPFVGPAGKLLDDLCEELGIPRKEVFVTNAVKHFKWQRAGKTRLHKKPNAGEVTACHPWLESETQAVRPKLILCLGATAAKSVFGKDIGITAMRGKIIPETTLGVPALATWHPSAVLRSPTPDARAQKRAELRADLARAWRHISKKH
jgi:DNA polymerase